MSSRMWQKKVTLDELYSTEFAHEVAEKKAQNIKTGAIIVFTEKFCEWDIEQYVSTLRALQLDVFRIVRKKYGFGRPCYRQVCELCAALEHFAEFKGVKNVKIAGEEYVEKEYLFGNTVIFYDD